MIFKIYTFLYNGFWEELKTDGSWKHRFYIFIRALFIIFMILCIMMSLFITLLSENEGSKTEIMSLYMTDIFTIFLTTNILLPWKFISITTKIAKYYMLFLIVIALIFITSQMFSLQFHEGFLNWSALKEIDIVLMVTMSNFTMLLLLFYFNFKLFNKKQNTKDLTSEWQRLTHWSYY